MNKETYQKMVSQDIGKTLGEINSKYNTDYQGEFCCFGLTNLLDNVFDWCPTYTSCTEYYNTLTDTYKLPKIPFIETNIGDLVFYDWDNSGDCDHIGIVYDVFYNSNQRILKVLEYNRSGTGTSWKTNKVGYREINIKDATNYHCKFVQTKLLENIDDNNDSHYVLNNGIRSMLIIQLALKSMGLYNGNCDGVAGKKTYDALIDLSNIIKSNI